jgi:maltose alpha-D-glucosyltransferase/alpha-amylase
MTAEEPTTLGMLQQLVESQGDGWLHAMDELGRFYDQIETRRLPDGAAPAGFTARMDAPVPPPAQDLMRAYLRTAETLGRRTAEVHLALASDSSVKEFSPEPFTPEDLAAITADAAAQAQLALETLRGRLTALPEEVAARAQELLASRDRLLDQVRATPVLEFAASKIRIHGDYHLGQVLWAEGDFYILDFEGEPARPIAQRRAKQSPLKDVAGMLRSFSYAAYAALFGHTAPRPEQFSRLEPWARIWQAHASAEFLRGYFATAGGALFVPADPAQRDGLLRLFVLDKALYELNYELNNRPEWVRIPLWGILDLL